MNDGMGETMRMSRDLGLILPEIAVVLTGVVALLCGIIRRDAWAFPATIAGLLIATLLTVPLIGDETSVFQGTYRIDDLSVWAKLILLPATALAATLAVPEVRGTDREPAVYALLTLSTVGALALAGAGDMLFIVLGLLLNSLGTFALVAYPRNDRATEAAMKYFVFGSVSGAVMIFGLTFWFGGAGSTLLGDLGRLDGMRLPAVAGLIGVLVGLGYKASVTPFHFWAPDAYDGAPLAVAAYLSIVPKTGAIFALARAVQDLPGDVDWRPVVAGLAVASMTYGNLAALVQTNVVRLLAYSSIAQAGYFLLGIAALGKSDLAIRSLIVFGAAYAAMNTGAFAIVATVGRDLAAFAGLGRRAPLAGGAMVIFLLSLVGVPPLGGFIGKLLLFGAAVDAGYAWLAVIAVVNSVLSLAVYLRVIVPMYQPADGHVEDRIPAGVVWRVALVLTVAIGIATEAITRALA